MGLLVSEVKTPHSKLHLNLINTKFWIFEIHNLFFSWSQIFKFLKNYFSRISTSDERVCCCMVRMCSVYGVYVLTTNALMTWVLCSVLDQHNKYLGRYVSVELRPGLYTHGEEPHCRLSFSRRAAATASPENIFTFSQTCPPAAPRRIFISSP